MSRDEMLRVKSPSPTGGTFTIRWGELVTDPLPHDATQREIDAAVEIARLRQLVKSAYCEGFADGRDLEPNSDLGDWENSESKKLL